MNINVINHKARPAPHQTQTTEALVLNCMDHRLVGPVADYLDGRGLRGRYDQIVLAGGAIGVMSGQTNAWSETFWQHVKLARELHGIRKIIIIDHRDCGSCMPFKWDCGTDEREHETVTHMIWMEALADEFRTREPDLAVELLLMDLDGSVERIDP